LGADPPFCRGKHYPAMVSGALRSKGKMVSSGGTIVSSLQHGGMTILAIFQRDKARRGNPPGPGR
jgi:hypothetical protein